MEIGPAKERKKTGYAHMIDVWNLPLGQHIVVRIGKRKQPMGQAVGILGDFLGAIGRHPDMALINLKWKDIPSDIKDMMGGVVEVIVAFNFYHLITLL